MGSVGRHSGASSGRGEAVSALLTITVTLGLAGMSVYALLFMFDAGERLEILLAGCTGFLGGFACCAPLGRKAFAALLLLSAPMSSLLPHWLGRHFTSVPAPAVLVVVMLAVAFAGLFGGIITGVIVFDESRRA